MKLTTCRQLRRNHGTILLIVMGVVVVLGIALAAILSLTTHENRILARTSAWNSALPAAEAGIEEAMSHLQQVHSQTLSGSGSRAINGWTASGLSFVFNRTMDDSQFLVGISSATTPVIMSVGQVWCPSAGRHIERRIQVTTTGRGIFIKGLMANGKITMNGQFSSDSFDSLNPSFSTNGQYDPAKNSDNGDVGTNFNLPDAMDLGGQVKIYGQVSTGPAGTVKIDSQASVGSTNWVDGGNFGIQSGYYTKDMNVSFPSVIAPYTNGPAPSAGVVGGIIGIGGIVVGGTSYKYILEDGMDYRLSTLVLNSSDKVLVRGKARLLVDQDVSISGSAFIQINTSASLELYVKKSDVSISGSAILNQSGNAANFSLWGLPGLTDIKLSGGGSLIGTIYAPQAKLSMSGGGSDELDFIGAGVVNEVNGTGHFRFHYDESLGYNSAKNLVVASWKEL